MIHRLSQFAVLLVTALTLAAAAPASAGPEQDTRAVIEGQLEAFQRDAWAEAFAFAAPSIQQRFGDPENFGVMVRNGYPMVWRPSAVEFLDAIAEGGFLVQRLQILDAAGQGYIAQYLMTQIDGVWRIAGVSIERAPVAGA